ncbi:hypothetical protein HGM15179_013914 [Zosterops borbonicus]|uniref:Uncharacterized protein n=1 Tax=Zosterops borbonicus TaxID=364589 RepID=A0A8K1G780_9PASS|nr:hypothetical protein HGM15179_013914 [Zosterops borbonicus]
MPYLPQDNCSPGLVDGVREQNGPPVIQEEAVREMLIHLYVHKSMGPDGIHPRVMRELADELVKPPSIIYQQSYLMVNFAKTRNTSVSANSSCAPGDGIVHISFLHPSLPELYNNTVWVLVLLLTNMLMCIEALVLLKCARKQNKQALLEWGLSWELSRTELKSRPFPPWRGIIWATGGGRVCLQSKDHGLPYYHHLGRKERRIYVMDSLDLSERPCFDYTLQTLVSNLLHPMPKNYIEYITFCYEFSDIGKLCIRAYKIMNISTTLVVNGATFSWKTVAAGSIWDPVPIDDLDEMIVCTLIYESHLQSCIAIKCYKGSGITCKDLQPNAPEVFSLENDMDKSYSQHSEENGALGTALTIGSGSQPLVELEWGQAKMVEAGDVLRALTLCCPTMPQ